MILLNVTALGNNSLPDTFSKYISPSHSEFVEERLLRPWKRSQPPFDGHRMIVRLTNGEVSGR
jgi:hypothetical protein